MSIAINKDIEKKYLEAVGYYEDEIKNSDLPDLDTFINLSFLYWEFAMEHFEFNIPNNIPDELSVIGGERFSKIIELGLEKYPNSSELNFWKRYFAYRLFHQDFSENDCEDLLKMYGENESLVPYFFLYLFNKEKYKEKRDELLEICIKIPTAKNIYISTMIH